MNLLIFISLFVLAFDVYATTMSIPPTLDVTPNGTKAVVDIVKSDGAYNTGAQSARAAEKAAQDATALANNIKHQQRVELLGKNRIIPTSSPVLKPKLGEKVLSLLKNPNAIGVGVGAAVSVVCGFTSICDEMKQAIKDWLDHGALGIDKDGNPTEAGLVCPDGLNSASLCESWVKDSPNLFNPKTGALDIKPVAIVVGINAVEGSVSCQVVNTVTGVLGQGGSIACSGGSGVPADIAVSSDYALVKLNRTPVPDPDFEKMLNGLHAVAEKLDDLTVEPEAEDPIYIGGDWIPDPNGGSGGSSGCPITSDTCDSAAGGESGGSVDLGKPHSIETTPDGKVKEKRSRVDCTQTGVARIECQKLETTDTTMPDGSVQRESKISAPTPEELGLEKTKPKEPAPDVCKEHPDYIACSKYGEVPKAEELKVTDVKIELSPTSLGSGSCPSSIPISLSTGTISMDLQVECDFATKIKPIIVAFAWLAAGFIVVGGVRES